MIVLVGGLVQMVLYTSMEHIERSNLIFNRLS